MACSRSLRISLWLALLLLPYAFGRPWRLPPGLRTRLQYSLSVPRPRLSQYLLAFWSSPAAQYRRLLEEQRDLLERQLRQTRQELVQMRRHYRELQQQKNSPITSEQVKLYHARILALEKEIQSAAELRTKLERALELEERKVQALQAKVKKLEDRKAMKLADQQTQVEELRGEMEAAAAQQLKELRAILERRMEEALENARIAAEQEKQLAIEETTNRLTKEFQRQLEQQKRSADEAVERERVKMRNLIKALAQRERNLLQHAEAQKSQRIPSAKANTNREVGSNPQPVRGPRK